MRTGLSLSELVLITPSISGMQLSYLCGLSHMSFYQVSMFFCLEWPSQPREACF